MRVLVLRRGSAEEEWTRAYHVGCTTSNHDHHRDKRKQELGSTVMIDLGPSSPRNGTVCVRQFTIVMTRAFFLGTKRKRSRVTELEI
jgi:hypothetical protein